MNKIINPKTNEKAAKLSIFSNSSLIILKLIAGIITNSFSIISEAIHSMSDLLASFIAFFAVKKSAMPADKDHAFGHGKYEDFSGLIEGTLIILAGLYIVYEASKKLIAHTQPQISVDLAIYIMLFSVVINALVSCHLFKTAKKTGSIALFADAEHLRTDIYTSLGVVVGLFLIKITNIHILDPIIALIVAVLILQAGYSICRKTVSNLLDESLSEKEEQEIIYAINLLKSNCEFEIDKLKTRKSGVRKNIEITICVNGDMSVKDSHKFCNEVENILSEKIGNTETIIHIEPIVYTKI